MHGCIVGVKGQGKMKELITWLDNCMGPCKVLLRLTKIDGGYIHILGMVGCGSPGH